MQVILIKPVFEWTSLSAVTFSADSISNVIHNKYNCKMVWLEKFKKISAGTTKA